LLKRILVVDDEPEVRTVIGEFLGGHGFEVLHAGNGLEALLQVKRARPDGVILDIQMPRLGGLEALKRIHAFDAAITVVVVSGVPDPELRQQARAGGAVAVLDKPVVLADLLAALGGGAPAPAVTAPTSAGGAPTGGAPAGAAVQVLVVDDDPDIRGMLQEFLEVKNWVVRTVPDGASAVRAIVHTPPDVILLDIEMPGLSGVDALPTIRSLAPHAAVIMVSGSTDDEISKLALARGAFDYVTKPIDFGYLTQSIETAVAMRSLER
jgi:CheY-like chemotaxis protein